MTQNQAEPGISPDSANVGLASLPLTSKFIVASLLFPHHKLNNFYFGLSLKLFFKNHFCARQHSGPVVSAVASKQEYPEFDSESGHFCVEFACSPCVSRKWMDAFCATTGALFESIWQYHNL